MTDTEWLLFLASLPSTPSSLRVNVWRRMKAIGAISPHNGVWMLPFSEKNVQSMNEVRAFVDTNQGVSYLFTSKAMGKDEERAILEKFSDGIVQEYVEFIEKCEGFVAELESEIAEKKFTFAELEENEGEMQKLTSWMRKLRARDYFNNDMHRDAKASLDLCHEKLKTFARSVYAVEGIDIADGDLKYQDE